MLTGEAKATFYFLGKGVMMIEFLEREKYGKKTGIYAIRNEVTGRIYIGQTREGFGRRFLLHSWSLRHGKHFNRELQTDWDAQNGEGFSFEAICVAGPEFDYDAAETSYIKTMGENSKLYNIQSGGRCDNLVQYVTAAGRAIVGQKNKQRLTGCTLSEDTKRKMSEARAGKMVYRKTNKITPETAKKIKQRLVSGARTRDICNEFGVSYHVVNGILSLDNWKIVHVDGWNEFQQSRDRVRGKRVGTHKV